MLGKSKGSIVDTFFCKQMEKWTKKPKNSEPQIGQNIEKVRFLSKIKIHRKGLQ